MNFYMEKAIENAKKGIGWTNPNPLVGAVIVKDGKIIAEGYHHKCGDLHAERDALKNARENNVDVKGATMYVTLEPCCHHGRQPPCVEAIVEAGIKKVVIGSRDPNPLVNGGGVQYLKDKGIEVVQDFLKDECDEINPVFFHFIKTKTPYVVIKYAMTMDGETATSTGESKWITGEEARKNVHKTRSELMAIMTGIGTVLKDNPTMNVRLPPNSSPLIPNSSSLIPNPRQPIRIVLDSDLRIPLESNIVVTANDENCGRVIIFCSEDFDEDKAEAKAELEKQNITVIPVDSVDKGKKIERLNIETVLKKLGELGIDSVFVESGGTLNASLLLPKNLADEVHIYIAPKIFGNDGRRIFNPVRNLGIAFPDDCAKFGKPEIKFFGEDVLLKYKRC